MSRAPTAFPVLTVSVLAGRGAPEVRQIVAQRVSAGICEGGAPGARHMSHTYAQNVVHVVFSTKDRSKAIHKELRPKLWAYIAGICKSLGVAMDCVGGTEDHVHLLIQVPPILPVAKAVATIKANPSRWTRESGYKLKWQQGTGHLA